MCSSLILHVGAGKCGSSAFQTALSHNPTLRTRQGHRIKYYATAELGRERLLPVTGHLLSRRAKFSPYGYASYPNFVGDHIPHSLGQALQSVIKKTRRRGHSALLSSEGWIKNGRAFGAFFDAQSPRVKLDVLAYLRPPVDWLNASFWQWGVWNFDLMQNWMMNGLQYSFATDLQRWSDIRNVTLHVYPARPDVVARFCKLYDTELPNQGLRNQSSPPSLIGFLLRNRQFRLTGNDAASEFVFQRWCPPTGERRPWMIAAHHVHHMRPVADKTLKWLETTLPETVFAEFYEDKRWRMEKPYHEEILKGPTPLHRLADLPGLYDVMVRGISQVAQSIHQDLPPLPDKPGGGADLKDWDKVLRTVFETLLDLDSQWRLKGTVGLRISDKMRGLMERANLI